jgi:heterodisulfide reductase subunit A-like polyferredoxin
MKTAAGRILYCHCAYARVVPPEVKQEVLAKLAESGVSFEAVPDLCEMSARKDPRLADLAREPSLKIAACYPRAVKWLFSAAGTPLPAEGVEILNMREEAAAQVLCSILGAES